MADVPVPRRFWNWFDRQFHSTLIDLADEPLIEEEI